MKNARKVTVRSMTFTHGDMKVKDKHDVIQPAAQEKVTTSTHSMNDVITFYVFNTRFKSSASITSCVARHLAEWEFGPGRIQN